MSGIHSLVAGSGGNPPDPYYSYIKQLIHFDDSVNDSGPNKRINTNNNVSYVSSPAKFGKAGEYNGASDYVTFSGSSGTWETASTNPYTLEFWVYHTSFAAEQTYIHNASGNYFKLLIDTSKNIRFELLAKNAVWASGMNTGQWYHIFIIKDSRYLKCYVNGVQVGSTVDTITWGGSLVTLNNMSMGRDNGGGRSLAGYLDDFRLTDGVARPVAVPTAAFPNY
jgi:hypothetical protein